MKLYTIIIFVLFLGLILYTQIKIYRIGRKYTKSSFVIDKRMLSDVDKKKVRHFLKVRLFSFFLVVFLLIIGFFLSSRFNCF